LEDLCRKIGQLLDRHSEWCELNTRAHASGARGEDKWRKYELDKYDPWKTQTQRVLDKKEQLVVQLEKKLLLGRIAEVKADEANKEWGKTLRLASSAILDQTDGTVRVIHDGTHGIHVNRPSRFGTKPGVQAWQRKGCHAEGERCRHLAFPWPKGRH
jgi:hypothetical protein